MQAEGEIEPILWQARPNYTPAPITKTSSRKLPSLAPNPAAQRPLPGREAPICLAHQRSDTGPVRRSQRMAPPTSKHLVPKKPLPCGWRSPRFWGAGTHVPEAPYPFRTAIMFGVTLGSPTEFSWKVRVCGYAGDVQNAGTHVLEAPYPNGDHVWRGSVVFNVSIILSWLKKLKPLKTVKTSPDVVWWRSIDRNAPSGASHLTKEHLEFKTLKTVKNFSRCCLMDVNRQKRTTGCLSLNKRTLGAHGGDS